MFLKFLVICAIFSFVNSLSEHPILLVISYDAFGHNYFEKHANPRMEALRQKGAYTSYVKNVFPTKTFPNHHSIATGLYPDRHGVVGNSYYDSETDKLFSFSYELFHYNKTIEPIWRLNERAGNGRHSGSMMWPGASFEYQGEYPTYVQKFEPSLNWYRRINIVLSWIEDPTKPANLVMMYFDEPDVHGHAFGPDSKIVSAYLKKLDDITNYLEQQIEVKGLQDRVNVIHLSDHGMVTVTPEHFINITKVLSHGTYQFAGKTPCLHVIPNEGFEDEIYNSLKQYSGINGHFKVYKKSEMPDRWRYKNNPRTPSIFLLADKGYGFQDLAKDAQYYATKYKFKLTNSSEFGVHGYDNEMSEMHSFFMGRGPHFKVNHTVPPFDIVDFFSLFCNILNIVSTDNDGSFDNVRDMLVDYHEGLWPLIVIVGTSTLVVLFVILCIAALTIIVIKRQQNITTRAALKKRFPQSQCNVEAQHLLEPEDA